MKSVEAARKFWPLALAALALTVCLALPARAGETGSTDEYAGVPITGSVLLDPFDPVPAIQFRHGDCDYDCRRHHHWDGEWGPRCHDECRWHGWYCPHDCDHRHDVGEAGYNLGWWRCADDCRNGDWWCDHDCRLEGWHCERNCYIHEPCDRDCGNRPPYGRHEREHEGEPCRDVCYGRLMREYEETLQHSRDEHARYDEETRWYFEHVMDRHDYDRHDFDHHDFDHHDEHPGEHHDEHHDGPPPGEHHDEHHDGPPPGAYGPPPGDHHDGPPPGASGYGPGPGGPGYGPGPAGPDYGPPPGAGASSYGPPPPPPPGGPGGPPPPTGPGPGAGNFGPPGSPPPPPPPH